MDPPSLGCPNSSVAEHHSPLSSNTMYHPTWYITQAQYPLSPEFLELKPIISDLLRKNNFVPSSSFNTTIVGKPCYGDHSLLWPDSFSELSTKQGVPFLSWASSSLSSALWSLTPKIFYLRAHIPQQSHKFNFLFPSKSLPSKYLRFLECLSMKMSYPQTLKPQQMKLHSKKNAFPLSRVPIDRPWSTLMSTTLFDWLLSKRAVF